MPRVRFALGVSAGNAASYDDDVEESLRRILHDRRASVLAIGRCGLGESDDVLESRDFERQVALARAYDLPLIIGATGSWMPALKRLESIGFPGRGVLVSGFDGPRDELEAWCAAGAYVSFDARAANDSERFSEFAQLVPADRILIESGAPCWTVDELSGARPRADQVVFVAAALKNRVDPGLFVANFTALFSKWH